MLLRCKDVTVRYNGHEAVSNVSFEVEHGGYVCVVGENGSGKSTLLRGILGLLPLSGGSVEYCLEHNGGPHRIGYMPQKSQINKDFPASVQEVVISGCSKGLFHSRFDKERARENLGAVGIDNPGRPFSQLSGGQQQRVLLARALCAADELIVLDEPVAGLDPAASRQFYELLSGLNKRGMAILMVSHDVGTALAYADKVLEMSRAARYFGSAEGYSKRAQSLEQINDD